MATEKQILSLIPESLRESLIQEISELIAERKQEQSTTNAQPVKGADPSIAAFAKRMIDKNKKH